MPRRVAILAVVAALSFACGGEEGTLPTAPSGPITPQLPEAFDAEVVRATPAPGGTLLVSAPNGTPVALDIVFSVSVPAGRAGTYNWNTALQAAHPPGSGFVLPVVSTAFQPVPLVVGVQEVRVTAFHTTNAVCYNLTRTPAQTLTLDIDVRAPGASLGQQQPQVLGKQFAAIWSLECQ